MTIDTNKKYQAVMHTTKGDITLDLFASEVPKTVNNFVFLARDGFYNGVTFHRIIKGFMIQGGDPLGTGSGGPGYNIPDELPVKRDYLRGTIAMARTSLPNSATSQFFIMHQNYNLGKDYVIFGIATSGLAVVDTIANTPTVKGDDGQLSKPTQIVSINSIDIIETAK